MPDQLEETSKKYPHPPGEEKRNKDRRWILNIIPKNSIGAEIGVFRGHFSELICEIVQPKKLYLVDPWELLGEFFGWGKEYTSHNTLPTRVARAETEARVAKYPQVEVRIISAMFPERTDMFEEPLDWIYIDASHQYHRTLLELKNAEKLIKEDGFILGDDFHARRDHMHHGVFKAVTEFVKTSRFEIVAAGPAGQWCLRRSA